ncbi:MAG: ATP-binding protein [Propionivibrio sp.]|nr:ATP-binding protein [Propionivibrio sp.]
MTAINLTTKPKTLVDADIVVGKDILELLANAMYIDPLTIYREYVQNAADSIDEAQMAGLSLDDPHITIHLDHATRTVRVRDNGESIPNQNFVKLITAIGASHKRGNTLRGFRGVGRLSGLGYCQELVFRGKAEGDSKVVEVSWNSRALKEKMRDISYSGSLVDIIREVVSYKELPVTDKGERFFEVELKKVQRLKNDLLMNEKAIRSYLSQVAPVPFHPDFRFGDEIQQFLTARGVRTPIWIELNDGAGPIYHRVRNTIEFNPKTSDSLRGIEYIELFGDDGELSAFGWIADHAYMGAIPKRLGLAGIRLRAGNIQVGDETLLAPLYPELRFAAWAIGDIHVSSKRIIPNGRRDDFEHNVHYSWLQSELSAKASELAHRIRTRSQQRQRLRNVQIHFQSIDDWYCLAEKLDTPLLLKKALHELTDEHVQKAAKEAIRLGEGTDDYQMAIERVEQRSMDVRVLGDKIVSVDESDAAKFSKTTERALLKALKVVLSNARSAKVGTKTALDIVAAVSGQ